MMFNNVNFKSVFDSATPAQAEKAVQALSSSEMREQQSVVETFRQKGLMIVLSVSDDVNNGNLDADELPIDALDDEIANELEGVVDDEDSTATDLLMGSIQDAFETLGVDETTIGEIFGDDVDIANSALEVACETVVANLPDEGEPLDTLVREFIFGTPSMDSCGDGEDETDEYDALKATPKAVKARLGAFKARKVGGKKIMYRGALAIRHGKKVIVNKRIQGQGKIRLSAKQKAGLKKARARAFTANAIKMRVKSLRKGHKIGIYKNI